MSLLGRRLPRLRLWARAGGRGGFTLVEVAMAVAVLSILTRLALPNIQEALMRARAAAAFGDVEVVRTAVAAYHERANQWPAEAPAGVVPAGLEEDLPAGFSFDRGDYQLDWDRWEIPADSVAAERTLLGISIATGNSLLGNAVAGLIGPQGWYTLGNNATFLIEGI